jgi:hypothetical protein
MAETRKVYLDHSATTPADARVVEAMLPYLTEKFGNASSVHFFGQEARAAVDRARRDVAALIGARANEIVFVSGGTEANNLAIRGVCEAAATHGRHVITSAIEHSSVRGICEALEKTGWEITQLPAYDEGIVRTEDVRAAFRPDTMKSARFSLSKTSARWCARNALADGVFGCTRMRCKLPAGFQLTSRRLAAICYHFRRTSSTRRKERAHSSFAEACV